MAWVPFPSTLYPYTVQQPSSFRHLVFPDPTSGKADFFFPDLGSFTTNVNIRAEPLHTFQPDGDYFQSIGGQKVKRVGWYSFEGRRWPIVRANFKAVAGNWTEERISFPTQTMEWHLTMSYDVRYKKMRALMLRMLQTFRIKGQGRQHS